MGRIILVASLICVLKAHAQTQSITAYADECEAKLGAALPSEMSCSAGTGIPVTVGGVEVTSGPSPTTCDRPSRLLGDCRIGSTFQNLPSSNPDVNAVLLCRKKFESNVGTSNFGDIAIIQTNKVTGATCFFQALGDTLPNAIDKPGTGTFPWFSPADTATIQCHACHDNGALIRSPYLTQVASPNQLPGSGDPSAHRDQPYFFPGADFANWRTFKVKVANNTCTGSCHFLGMSNTSGGTARKFGVRATATSEMAKMPHSATSPIWMAPGQTTFLQTASDSAAAVKTCAESAQSAIANMGVLPSSSSCTVQDRGVGLSWSPLGGDGLATPTIVGSTTSRFDVFVRGTDGLLYWNSVTAGVASGWNMLGGPIEGAPAAVRRSSGIDDLDVYVRGTDNALHRKERRFGNWGGWISMGGVVLDSPSAAVTGNGVVVAYRTTGNALGAVKFDGFFWNLPESLGGGMIGAPTVVSWGSGRADVFLRGTDNRIYEKTLLSNVWVSGFYDLGGGSFSNVAAIAPYSGRLELAVRGTDNQIHRKTYNGNWGSWVSLGGLTNEKPAIAYDSGSYSFYAKGTDDRFHRNRVTGGTSAGWASLGPQVFWFGPAAATVNWGESKPIVVGDQAWGSDIRFLADP